MPSLTSLPSPSTNQLLHKGSQDESPELFITEGGGNYFTGTLD